MGMYKKLLVAVDGSEISMHAFKESLKISKEDLLVIAVAPPYSGDLGGVGTSDIGALLRQPCEQALDKAMKLAQAERVQIRPVCVMGEPYEAIVETAEEEGRDLIVMGVRGRSMAERLLVGSTTARVIGFSSQDVLVVPEKGSIGWDKILVATDGSEYSRRAVDKALDIVKDSRGTLTVVSVLEISPYIYAVAPEIAEKKIKLPQKHVAEVKELAASLGLPVEGVVREAECADEVITDVAREQHIDLIVVGSHGRTGLKRLLMGSVTEKVIAHAPCPVLVVKL
jgi:nucleotide-binding universal stress UspA family protein|uniref:Universal stress protein n=1 Tax=Desulfobacca acetoxidans TaxID=60893 RepID=A0A7V6DRA0_9BACT